MLCLNADQSELKVALSATAIPNGPPRQADCQGERQDGGDAEHHGREVTFSGGLSVESLPSIFPPSETQNHGRFSVVLKWSNVPQYSHWRQFLCPNIAYAHVSSQHVTFI